MQGQALPVLPLWPQAVARGGRTVPPSAAPSPALCSSGLPRALVWLCSALLLFPFKTTSDFTSVSLFSKQFQEGKYSFLENLISCLFWA